MNLGLFYISVVRISILMTWLHNNSNSNIFVALTYHSIGNSIKIIVDGEGVSAAALSSGEHYYLIIQFIIVLVVVIIWGPKTLTRSLKKIFKINSTENISVNSGNLTSYKTISIKFCRINLKSG